MIGWVKLPRSIRDNPAWKETPFDKGRALIDLILRANYKDSIWNGRLIPRGSLVTSIKKLCLDWGWTRQAVRSFLNNQGSNHQITILTTKVATIISITNYDSYDSLQPSEQPTLQPSNNQPNNHILRSKEKETKKKELNTKKIPAEKFEVMEAVFMTREEVQKLEAKFGIEDAKSKIEALSLWILAKGKQKDVKSAYATILNWDRMRQEGAKCGGSMGYPSQTINRGATAILRPDGSVDGEIDFNRLPASAKVGIMNANVVKHFEEKERLENLNKNKEITNDNRSTNGEALNRILRAVPQLGTKIGHRG